MEFGRYLNLMGRMYFQGATSNDSYDLLRRYGGALKLAGDNAQHIREDPDSILGMQRRMEDRWTAARIGWRRHADQIERRLHRGESPTQAIYQHMRDHGTYPHRPEQVELMTRPSMTTGGAPCATWQVEAVNFRRRLRRGAGVMGDTFGAITTMLALSCSGVDWANATPDQWDDALDVGEVGRNVGQMWGAHTDALAGNTRGFDRHEGLD